MSHRACPETFFTACIWVLKGESCLMSAVVTQRHSSKPIAGGELLSSVSNASIALLEIVPVDPKFPGARDSLRGCTDQAVLVASLLAYTKRTSICES